MSVKTPVFAFDTPVLGEEANVPADLLSLATEIENVIKALEVKRLKTAGAGDDKKLLIVDATGVPNWRAMSGDATISNLGALTIANEAVNAAKILALTITEAKLAGESVGTAKIVALAVNASKLAAEAVETAKLQNLAVTEAKLAGEAVGTAKIKALAVTEAKIAELAVTTSRIANLAITEGKLADGAVSSRKFKPTSGEITPSAGLVLTEAYVLIPGMKLEITPPVASVLFLNVTLQGSGSEHCRGQYWLDGVEKDFLLMSSAFASIMGSSTFRIPLTAAEHTIEIRAKKFGAGACTIANAAGWTRMNYVLVSS